MDLEEQVWRERYGLLEGGIEAWKRRARGNLAYHLRAGNIKRQSCEYADCGETETEGHHYDYDEPLEVIWLCHKHHGQLHRTLNQELELARG